LAACTGTTTVKARQRKTTPETTDQVEFKDFGPEPFVFDIEEYTTGMKHTVRLSGRENICR
jgi:hypothetical protein